MCIGCRERATTRELIRLVLIRGSEMETEIAVDESRSLPGRGAHLHPTHRCYELAVRRRQFPVAWRGQVDNSVRHGAVGTYLDSRSSTDLVEQS